jgi:Glycosyltransferase family 9 (heptosyltransferase)
MTKLPVGRTTRMSLYSPGGETPNTFPDGTWLEAESFAYPNGGFTRRAYASFPDGSKKVVKVSIPDTFFTIPASRPAGSYLDLRGQTTLPELVAAIAAADLIIALDTGPMHIAAAVGTPAVVIYGGYIDPVCTGYPGNINLYSAVECAPCWMREPCPHGKKCLHMITPAQVESALDQLWERPRRHLVAQRRPCIVRCMDRKDIQRSAGGPPMVKDVDRS